MDDKKHGVLDEVKPAQRSRLLGDIVTLMTRSSAHANYKIQYFSSVVLPPVQLNQYRIYHNTNDEPVGFVSWAMLSKEVEKKFLKDAMPLTLKEWASGDIIYIMEFIAPFGHAKKIIADLKKKYPNQKAYAVRHDASGKNGQTITTFYGEGFGRYEREVG